MAKANTTTDTELAYGIFLRLPEDEKRLIWESMPKDMEVTEANIAMATARCIDQLESMQLPQTGSVTADDVNPLKGVTAGEISDDVLVGIFDGISDEGKAVFLKILRRQFLKSMAKGTLLSQQGA